MLKGKTASFLRLLRRDSVGRDQHSSNRVRGISTRTIHQFTTPTLSQTIWPRWASRQYLALAIVQTLLPVTFGYSLSSQPVAHKRGLRWGLPEVVGTVQPVNCSRRRLLWRARLEFYVCTINKSAHTKKSLETYLMILVYIYIYKIKYSKMF